MLFWIALVIAISLGVWFGHSIYKEEGIGSGVGATIFGTAVSSAGLALVLTIVGMSSGTGGNTYKDTESITWTLKALGNNTAVHGKFYFLGGGYIGEKKVINYITKDGSGAIRVESIDAAGVKIFEDTNNAHLKRIKTEMKKEWLVPWTLSTVYHYDFHIPEGSVLESYNVDVAK